jgi:segregation and condensation protein A
MSEPSAGYLVELPVFTGPFRLLAELIVEQKVDVCDVPLSHVTEGFIRGGAERLPEWSLEEGSWFLAICALLVEMKVGRLLPRRRAEDDDELEGSSPDLLYARSIELAAFRAVSTDLAARMAAASLMLARPAGIPADFAHVYPDLMERITPAMLGETAGALLAPTPRIDLSHVTPIHASLADALRDVQDQLAERQEARFRDLLSGCRQRIDVVVRFLALLELYREGKVELSQSGPLGDIRVRLHTPGRHGNER